MRMYTYLQMALVELSQSRWPADRTHLPDFFFFFFLAVVVGFDQNVQISLTLFT